MAAITSSDLYKDLKTLLGITVEGVTHLKLELGLDDVARLELTCHVFGDGKPKQVTRRYQIEEYKEVVDVSHLESVASEYIVAE